MADQPAPERARDRTGLSSAACDRDRAGHLSDRVECHADDALVQRVLDRLAVLVEEPQADVSDSSCSFDLLELGLVEDVAASSEQRGRLYRADTYEGDGHLWEDIECLTDVCIGLENLARFCAADDT